MELALGFANQHRFVLVVPVFLLKHGEWSRHGA
jgi:hypothetical protein